MNLWSKRRLIALLCSAFLVGSFFVYAQEANPDLSVPAEPLAQPPSLPPLRAAEPAKSRIKREIAMQEERAASRFPKAISGEDMAKVVPLKCIKPKGKFPWNADKAKISDLLEQISRITCKSFIISSGVKPTQEISMISRSAITVDQAWQLFLSALESNQLALVETGGYYKIVNRKDSIRQPLPLVDDKNQLPSNEAMVTYLHDVRHMSKDVAITLTKGLISSQGDVMAVGDSFLVISDGSSNIRRIMAILEKVDIVGAANRVHVVQLEHADAVQVQAKLTDIFDSKNANDYRGRRYNETSRSPRSGNNDGDSFSVQKIIADERTNKVITIASDSAYVRIKQMIAILDVESSDASTQSQMNVYYLKNGDAKKIAATLSAITQGNNSAANRRGSGSRMGFREEGVLFEGDIKITADEATNGLVIVASPRDYKSLSAVIAKLDKERIQVYVEAAILDIGLTDTNDFGVNGFGVVPGIGLMGNPNGMKLATGLVGLGASAVAGGLSAGLASLPGMLGAFNMVGAPADIPGLPFKIPSFGVVLEALQKNSNVDVLSTPSLMTLDNEKAEMSVGEKIPTVSGASTVGGANGLGIPIQNITQQDVKLKFAITPHVNENNLVRLEIDQDVNELGEPESLLGATQYRIRTKSIKTTISAKDQQTIVLGGLIHQSQREIEVKIPWLGDIPILGYLAKHKTKIREKKNLLLVLTPYVIRSEDDLGKLHERKIKEREEFGRLYFGDKITKFDPHVDYTKKTGPLHRLLDQIDTEMKKVENGGPGSAGETVIKNERLELQKKPLNMTVKTPDENIAPSNSVDDGVDDEEMEEEEIVEEIPDDFEGEEPEPPPLNSPVQ
jgi:general secretion pathway protein D